ncbi:MAG: YlxR family protein [Actinomycetota bacterium]
MRDPHEPERTCVGCRGKAPKRSLLRLAVDSDGRVAVDPTGRQPGRGAYLHRDRSCVDAALAHGALVRALGAGAAPPDPAARLRQEIEGELHA